MVLPQSGKALANESNYPYIVELAVGADELDFGLSRRITEFHQLRHIKPRHGRRIVRGGKVHYRWCFSDLATARAFVEHLEETFSRVPFFKGPDFSDLWKLSMTDSNDERAEAER